MVIENPHFGRMLVLDGVVQITERDEFFYHEMLAHVVMHAHPNPKKVVVVGGGDGGVVREVLKHPSMEKVYFIEIDEEVIKVSKKFFPAVAGSVTDRRVEIKCMDGAEFVRGRKSDIDLGIVDSTDIVGFAKSLFTKKFFRSIMDCTYRKRNVRHPFGITPFPQGHSRRSPGNYEIYLPCCRPLYRTHSNIRRELVVILETVVSGGARGIDTAAHLGALKENGVTYAVLPSGFNQIHPTENEAMAKEVVRDGGLLSEYLPDATVNPGRLISRNRLIVGLAQAVVGSGENWLTEMSTDELRKVVSLRREK